MDPVMSHSIWVWLGVVGVWSFILAAIDLKINNDNLSLFGFVNAAILFICIFIAAVFGTAMFIQYQQAWPFIPQ